MDLNFFFQIVINACFTITFVILSYIAFKKHAPPYIKLYYLVLFILSLLWIKFIILKSGILGNYQYFHSLYLISAGFSLLLMGIVIGITPLILKRRAYNSAQEQLAWIIRSTPCGVVSCDLEGKILSWNKGAEKIFGYQEEEVLGRNISFLILPGDDPDAIKEHVQKINRGEMPPTYEAKRRHKSGMAIDLLLTSSKIFNDEGEVIGACALISDIFPLKRLEMELKKTIMQLESKNEDLKIFGHLIAHDLRSPLRAINFLTQSTLEDLNNPVNEFTKQYFSMIIKWTSSMEQLIISLLSYFQLEKNPINPEEVNCITLISDIIEMHLPGHSHDIHLDQQLPIFTTYKVPLNQVFTNLIINAFKHHHHPTTRNISISHQDNGQFFEFCVADNGPGIAASHHKKIFKLFEPGTSKDSEGNLNTGIGLAITKRLIEKVGGHLWFESPPDGGAVFHFLWPKST